MTWNYRIVKYKEGSAFGLHEVYYNEHNEVSSWTVLPASFVCDLEEGPEGIQKSLRMALDDALNHPVLDESELENMI